MTPHQKVLLYFADPMCSWCWGFSPVITQVHDVFGSDAKIKLVLGGLRPNETQALDEKLREEILHHWHSVQELTGLPFQFDNALPQGFVYNTEPPSRAVITMAQLLPDSALTFFTKIQSAFYAEQKDVTQSKVLLGLLDGFDVDHDTFESLYNSEAVIKLTQTNFRQSYDAGIRGFPTLILQHHDSFELITHGYQPFDAVKDAIKKCLASQ